VAHPNYREPDPTHDLAVLILAEDVDVPIRRIAGAATLQAAFSVRLAGFGNTDVFSSSGYGRRRMVDVPIASNDPAFGADVDTEFVAGAPFLDRDSCNGDSGGPAYVQVGNEWQLAGATSRATASSFRPCGDGGIYTRVGSYEDWITSVPGGAWS
jgi:secreted trypsin-like serine protease